MKYSSRNQKLRNTLFERFNTLYYMGMITNHLQDDTDILELANIYLEMKPLLNKVGKIVSKRHAEHVLSGEPNFMELVAKEKNIKL